MTAVYSAWLYSHPRIRRSWILAQMLWGATLLALLTAPRASAGGFANAVSWTGITDTTGQPLGSYFIGTVSTLEAMRHQGSEASAFKPSTWVPALTDRFQIAVTYSQLSTLLGVLCGVLVGMTALAIWFIKFALGSLWLTWLAALAAPVMVGISHFVDQWNLMWAALLICLFVGAMLCYWRGFGTGLGVMFGGFGVLFLIWLFLRDPLQEMAGDNGMLAVGRNLGFQISLGVGNNGSLAPGSTLDGQIDKLGQWMATVLVRHPLQIANFGQVIDQMPGCAAAWNNALNAGSVLNLDNPAAGPASGPVTAMKACGNTAAVAHAQQLSGETVGLMLFINAIVFVLLMLLCYIGAEVIRIGFKTFWNLLVIIPAAAVAVAPGPQRQYAKRTVIKLIVHGIEMLFATAGFGIVLVIMSRITTNSIPGLSLDSPIQKMLVMLLIGGGAVLGFRALMRGFSDPGLPGPITLTKRVYQHSGGLPAWGPAMHHMGRSARNSTLDNAQFPQSGKPDPNEQGSQRAPTAPGRKPHPSPAASEPSRAGAKPPATGSAGQAPTSAAAQPKTAAAAAGTAGRAAPAASGGAAAGVGSAAAAGPAAPVVAGAMVATKLVSDQQKKRAERDPAASPSAAQRSSTPPTPHQGGGPKTTSVSQQRSGPEKSAGSHTQAGAPGGQPPAGRRPQPPRT
ncbi:MAG: hypothetical protein K0U78_20190 [Actinomycetia bacterium]|nr:hypothetical protein [Actinomycetes bacterium]